MLDVCLDAFLDSLKVFGIAFVIYFIFSFIHNKITLLFHKHKKISPLIGAGCGLIPECGISVIGADMYQKKQISMGTLLAIFFACSDEALFILFSDYKKLVYVVPLLLIKFVFAFILGSIVDGIHKKNVISLDSNELKLDCCAYEHEETLFHKHFLHPFLHCLKIFCYVFVVNLIFGIIIYNIGEESILSFLQSNKAFGPLVAGIIGLIPNCASSVLMSELFLIGGLSFGALVTGLSLNAGVGLVYLLKFKNLRKNVGIMTLILFSYSLVIGYLILGIMECVG
ncbi:MAG: arsenic efflux protein [Roseburia sp.]|nr:arsenic efflux protein [Anaeroplasma bactoclasticum]MCM1196956.1 arsenic efflux protein [Roseburia sp.]MCM1557542.1 arsenic efflux protein [Anaeroplasma bactoclasticum]